MSPLTLRTGRLQALILPGVGGGLARLDWMSGGRPQEVLRGLSPLAPGSVPLPSQLACFPLLPWSNRIAPGGFECDDRRVTPAPNRAGEPCPIHGDGWQQAWQVASHSDGEACLVLDRRDAKPFSYTASLGYRLDDAALHVSLEVRNDGARRLPFGLGLHPWMPDPGGAQLHAPAHGVWLSGADKLPRDEVVPPAGWDFSTPKPLPPDGADNVFSGWAGEAEISWPGRGLTLTIRADMRYYILYVPPGKDFFCFEPVDHAINAHNLPGGPQRNGLTMLEPGQCLRRRVTFGVAGGHV